MTDMDVVELVIVICPATFMLDVIDYKEHVFGYPVRLDGRQVHAMERGSGIRIGYYVTELS